MSSLGSVRSWEDGAGGGVVFVSCASCFDSTAFGERHCQSCENIDSMPAKIMIPVTAQKEKKETENEKKKSEKLGCLNVSPPQFLYLQLSHWHQSIFWVDCVVQLFFFPASTATPLRSQPECWSLSRSCVTGDVGGGKLFIGVCRVRGCVWCVLLTSNRSTHARYLAPILPSNKSAIGRKQIEA